MSYFVLMGRRIPKQAITGFKFQNETDNICPFLSIRIRGKEEILSFVRKVDSAEYRDHQDFMEFLRNVAADIWVEYTEPEQRGRLFNLMNKRNENSF